MNIAPQPPVGPGAVPGALPPPATAAAAMALLQAPAPVAPSTFAKLYSNPAVDAHAGVYGPVLAIFFSQTRSRMENTCGDLDGIR